MHSYLFVLFFFSALCSGLVLQKSNHEKPSKHAGSGAWKAWKKKEGHTSWKDKKDNDDENDKREEKITVLNDIKNPRRPHILFIMVDEMDGRIFDASSGQYQPPMKNIRKLITQGTHFKQAYTAAPLCTPARAAMMTGRYSSDIGVVSNGVGLAAVDGKESKIDEYCLASDLENKDCYKLARKQKSSGTFIDVLHKGGYGINLYGKLHVGGGLEQYAEDISSVMSLSAFGGFKASSQMERNFAREWSRATGVMNHGEGHPDHAPMLGTVIMKGEPAFPQDYRTANSCEKALLNGLFAQKDPQFLYCSFETPHPELRTNITYYNRINMTWRQKMPDWPDKETMHPADIYTAKNKGSWGIETVPKAEIEKARRVYFAMCEEADDLIGQVLNGLERGGGKENSYVILVSDHGDQQYENYEIDKETLREASTRIPFIITGPKVRSAGSVAQLGSLLDVYPTIMDIAGMVEPSDRGRGESQLAGESVLPIATKGKSRKQDFVVAEFHARDSGTGEFMIVESDWKLIAYGGNQIGQPRWKPQLFNLKKDAFELQDVSKKYPEEVERLYNLLNNQINILQRDKEIKAENKYMFEKYFYDAHGGASRCMQEMSHVYHGFDTEDAEKITQWLGKPCGGHHESVDSGSWKEIAWPNHESNLLIDPKHGHDNGDD